MLRSGVKKLQIALTCLIIVLFAGQAVTVAWYSHTMVELPQVGGSVTYMAKYFESGDGTGSGKYDPDTMGDDDTGCAYEIATAEQFYNLAWLQYMGYFDDKKCYFYLSADLDMTGYLLPPIGTTAHPFIGEFDGNGKTISKLHISSRYSDWESPPSYITDQSEVGTDIGVFGKIGSKDVTDSSGTTTTITGSVSKFYLKDLTVTTTVGGNVGLIAGNVEGNLSYVGVQNGVIDMDNTGGATDININSDYSLVGVIDPENVGWIDKPVDNTNSNLLIVPSNLERGTITTTQPVPDCVYLPVSDAHFGGTAAAKIVATNNNTMTVSAFTPDIKAYYFYKDTDLDFNNEYSLTSSTSVSQSFTQGKDPQNLKGETVHIEDEFWVSGQRRGIKPNGSPDWTVTNYDYPKNVIWFKPLSTGTCGIAFAPVSQNADGHMSIYRYVRDTNGGIINREEMVLTFPKKKFRRHRKRFGGVLQFFHRFIGGFPGPRIRICHR